MKSKLNISYPKLVFLRFPGSVIVVQHLHSAFCASKIVFKHVYTKLQTWPDNVYRLSMRMPRRPDHWTDLWIPMIWAAAWGAAQWGCQAWPGLAVQGTGPTHKKSALRKGHVVGSGQPDVFSLTHPPLQLPSLNPSLRLPPHLCPLPCLEHTVRKCHQMPSV